MSYFDAAVLPAGYDRHPNKPRKLATLLAAAEHSRTIVGGVMRVSCSECGCEHDLAQMSLVAPEPGQWSVLTDDERAQSELSRDQCIIRTEREVAFFVAASIELPILGSESTYSFVVWVSLSEKSFAEMNQHWTDPGRVHMGPYFGWLSTPIPGYPDTMYLKTMVHQRPVGVRPRVELEPTDHPLAVQQREGVEPSDLLAVIHAASGTGDG